VAPGTRSSHLKAPLLVGLRGPAAGPPRQIFANAGPRAWRHAFARTGQHLDRHSIESPGGRTYECRDRGGDRCLVASPEGSTRRDHCKGSDLQPKKSVGVASPQCHPKVQTRAIRPLPAATLPSGQGGSQSKCRLTTEEGFCRMPRNWRSRPRG